MKSQTIDGLLVLAAQSGPAATAVVDGERRLSYGELDDRSSRLAHVLCEHGVRPGDRVGLWLEKSLEAVIGVYATLKAGATYVPVDDQAPVARVAYITANAGIHCLISSAAHAGHWGQLRDAGAPLRTVIAASEAAPPRGIELVAWSELDAAPAYPPERHPDPDALAFILYTSGSTGEPKGVMLSHRNGLHFVDWAARKVGLHGGERLSSHAPLHFDLSTFDLFGAAWAAAPVHLVPAAASVFPRELAGWIRAQEITIWYSVPSILTQLVLRGDLAAGPLPSLRTVIFAGEVFPVKYLRQLVKLVPQARYLNFYGPTETNVCTWYEVPREGGIPEPLPIGAPIEGVRAIVQDGDGHTVAAGEPGELLIEGPTVMHGYWDDPERTARALVMAGHGRSYRTGDLVREAPDGALEFIGRRDAQIKTRGYRVELGEIEAALAALDVVVECAVVALPDETVTNRLKAFVVTQAPVSPAELAGACRARLPRYMIPEEFEFREALPKSSTGKIDRTQLTAA